MSEHVHVEVRDRIMVVSLRRPDKRNAVDRAVAEGIEAALDRLDDDPGIWVGVLTGTGDFFSAGTDLSGGDTRMPRGGEYGVIRRQRLKPLIAAVEGYALGGGLEMVLACDLVVAAENATFGLPEVARGVLPTCGALFRGPQALPLNVAKELVLTGQRIDAVRAERLGFVNRLTAPGDALKVAREVGAQIVANAPLSVQASVQAVNSIVGDGDALGWQVTEETMARLMETADQLEGVAAFLEKRPPVWTGR